MSDNAAKELEAPGGVLYEPLVRLLEEADPEDGSSGPLLHENGEIDKQEMARRICANLVQWSGGRLRAETIVFSHQNRELVRSQGAEEMIRACMER